MINEDDKFTQLNTIKFKKGVGIAIKTKETSRQLQLGRYIHACINETHCLANLQDLIPTLAGIIISSTNQPK